MVLQETQGALSEQSEEPPQLLTSVHKHLGQTRGLGSDQIRQCETLHAGTGVRSTWQPTTVTPTLGPGQRFARGTSTHRCILLRVVQDTVQEKGQLGETVATKQLELGGSALHGWRGLERNGVDKPALGEEEYIVQLGLGRLQARRDG